MTTTPNAAEANALAEEIVVSRLAACVQILPQITSVYIWDGKLQKEGEYMLLIKTLPEKYDELAAFITEQHSYDTPEIVAVEAPKVSPHYLAWLGQTLS